jgi:hypothetical protein
VIDHELTVCRICKPLGGTVATVHALAGMSWLTGVPVQETATQRLLVGDGA